MFEFWAYGLFLVICDSCSELDLLFKLYESYEGKGLTLLLVNIDRFKEKPLADKFKWLLFILVKPFWVAEIARKELWKFKRSRL